MIAPIFGLVYKVSKKFPQSTLSAFNLPHLCWETFYFKVPNYHHYLNGLSTLPTSTSLLCWSSLTGMPPLFFPSGLCPVVGGNPPHAPALIPFPRNFLVSLSQAEFVCHLFSDFNLTLCFILALIISDGFLFIFLFVCSTISCQLSI